MQVSLVSPYGPKDRQTARYLDACLEELSSLLGDAFCPYALEQVHGTIIGLEGRRHGQVVLNANSQRPMNAAALLAFLRQSHNPELRVQIGGFCADADYGFASRGQHPYLRAFSVQKRAAVTIGWPVRDGGYPLALDALRRRLNTFNIAHNLHTGESDIDNDFYMVLGHVAGEEPRGEAARRVESRMREFLSASEPLTLDVSRQNLSIVVYTDPMLPPANTRVISIDDPNLTPQSLLELY